MLNKQMKNMEQKYKQQQRAWGTHKHEITITDITKNKQSSIYSIDKQLQQVHFSLLWFHKKLQRIFRRRLKHMRYRY